MKPIRRLPIFLIISISFFTVNAYTAFQPAVVDQTPALEIGPYQVSRYLLNKYHQRYIEGLNTEHRIISPDEQRNWLKLFVAKQIVIAHIGTLGYFVRPEVQRNVRLMERHMLTQPEGPFYQRLIAEQPPVTEDRLKIRYANMFSTMDCVVVRFRDETAAASIIGPDFEVCAVEEQFGRIQKCRDQEGVEVNEKSLSWPFEPVSEIGDTLIAAPSLRWIKHREPGFGLYYIFKRSVKIMQGGDFLGDARSFADHANFVESQIIKRRRHNGLLTDAHFGFDEKVAARMIQTIRERKTDNDQIPAEMIEGVAAEQLFHYQIGTETIKVTTKDFCDHFNEGFVRCLPRSIADIRASAEFMTVQELDFRAAQALGIDQTAQFVEDRKGYMGLLALELFEREVLLTHLEIPLAEQYYQAHLPEFSQTGKIRGLLLKFPTLEQASLWRESKQALSKKAVVSSPKAVPICEQEMDVIPGDKISGLESFQKVLFESPESTIIGPVAVGKDYVCFLKEKNLETIPIPFAMVNKSIRRLLERQALDARESGLAAELIPRFQINDHIDYSRYEAGPSIAARDFHP